MTHQHDAVLQWTNDDACLRKDSACSLGYYEDPFLRPFAVCALAKSPSPNLPLPNALPVAPSRPLLRAPPLINRGYWVRVEAVRHGLSLLAERFPSGLQMVVLGAGFDTSFFWLRSRGASVRCVEVDFEEVVKRKAAVLAENRELYFPGGGEVLDNGHGGVDWSSSDGVSRYRSISGDIRHPDLLLPSLFGDQAFLSRDGPTVLLSECCTVYLPPEASDRLLASLAAALTGPTHLLMYEPVHPDDAFGRVMVANLEKRGCPLLGIHALPDLDSHTARLGRMGWEEARAWTMKDVMDGLIGDDDRKRVNRIEFMDEYEEFDMLMGHYVLVAAQRNAQPESSLYFQFHQREKKS